MTDLLHQQITTNDLVAHALSYDRDRLVLIGVDGERVTAGEMGDAISRMQQLVESFDPPPYRAAVLSKNRIEFIYADGLDRRLPLCHRGCGHRYAGL
jgi:hypothetical protein